VLVAGPHFRLLTLGVPMLVSAAGDAVRYRTRKHFALLIRLALEPGRKFVRDYLIELLWPDAAPERGRHSLSQAITVLRNTIGREHLAAHRSTLALAAGVIEVDALRLETCEAEIRGGFLEGFDLRGARGFDEWREGWSARLHPKIRDCLVKHMDAARRIGDFATVERHALVLEDLDPLSEDALRGIMEARAWVGDRSNALKAFNRFATRIADELNAKPSPELERVAGLLREGRRAAPRPAPDGVPPREERRFEAESIIGREREFSALYDAWLEVRQRKPRVMVVLGDPGIGKTTLTNSFVSSCQMDGAVIARAQAYDAERELPYAVLAELVRQLTLQRAIGGAEPEALAELSRLTPDILAVFPGVPSPAEWPPEVVPLRFADAFLKAVSAAADDNPVVLVVDDIHAADNASVGILHMLTRKLSGLRIMLILAGRTAELRTSGPPSALATDPAIEGLETIQLDCFSPKIASELVCQVGRLARAKMMGLPIDRIVRAGAGNPLAIELLTREWTIRGEESILNQLEALDRLPAPNLGIPIAVRAVFERQSRRLDSRTRSVLDLAAVLGRRLGALEMYEIVDCSPGEAASRLSELLASGLVREVQGQLEFRNELIRAKAYYEVAEQVRKQLHQRVASRLSSAADLDSSGLQLEIAWHWLRGGDSGKAMPFAITGAETSMLVGAPSEAAQVLCALLNDRTDAVAARRVRYLLAKAYLDQSRASEAIPILESLASEGCPDREEVAEIALCRASAEYLLNRQGGRTYGETASTALQAARETDNPKLLVRALFESSRSGLEIGDGRTFHQAHSEMKGLLSDKRYSDLPEMHYAYGFCESVLWRAQSAYVHIYEAKAKLGPQASPTQRSFIWNALGAVNTLLCRLEDAIVQFEEALQLSKKIGDESRMSTIASNLCSALTYQGSFEAAIEMGNYAINSGLKSMNQPLLVTAYTNLVDPYVLTGRVDEARHCLSAAKEWLAHDRSWFSRIRLLVEDADLHLMCGEQDLVLRVLAQIDSESDGRSTIFQPGLMTKLRAYRAALSGNEKEGLRIACEAERTLRNECPLAHLDALAARAWIETRIHGHTNTTKSVLAAIEAYSVLGRRALLIKEGFLPSSPPLN
jgi:DNA-binding SARP family transcriptional activator/tetratricopeptide (TPR) repeat protein